MTKIERRPRHCYFIPSNSYVEGHGFRVSIVTEGEPGHTPTGTWPYTGAGGETLPYFWGGDSYVNAVEHCCHMNINHLGLSAPAIMEIVGSAFTAQIQAELDRADELSERD